MDCYYCKGVDTVEEQLTRYCACELPDPFIVENVPSFVCRLCGDQSFSGETVTELGNIKNGGARVGSLQVLRVFDYARLHRSPTESSHPVTRILDTQTAVLEAAFKSGVFNVRIPEILSGEAIVYQEPNWEYMRESANTKVQLLEPWAQNYFSYDSTGTGFNYVGRP